MSIQLRDAWRTLVPRADDRHGPLPPLLILLTVVTGLVDAVSYLLLGHVFVANMTGNVVFLAFSLARAPGFTVWASLLAIAAFALGAVLGGRVIHRSPVHRGWVLLVAVGVQFVLILTAFAYAIVAAPMSATPTRIVVITLVAIGMGVQNAVARALGVPDLTTTVLTLTITGMAADSRLAGGANSRAGRRLLSVLSMFVGALVGAVLVAAGRGEWALLVAAALLLAVAVTGIWLARSRRPWTAE